MTKCREGEYVCLHRDEDLVELSPNYKAGTGPLFLRDFSLSGQRDFDRMTDSFILSARYAPENSLRSSGFEFIKRALKVDLPPPDTELRDGADIVLRALMTLLGDISSDL